MYPSTVAWNQAEWVSSTTAFTVTPTIGTNSTSSFFFPATGAAHFTVRISNSTGTAGGSPDTVSVYAVQTGSCLNNGTSLATQPGGFSQSITIGPNQWSVNAVGTTGALPTATNAAITGISHTAVCYSASIVQTSTTTGNATFQIKDGSTVIWVQQMATGGSTGGDATFESLCGLQLKGTIGNAMSCTFSGALTSAIESCSLSGFDQ